LAALGWNTSKPSANGKVLELDEKVVDADVVKAKDREL